MGRLRGVEGPFRPWPVLMGTAAVVAYAWWAAGLRPFTWPPLLALAVGGAAAIAFGTWARRPGEERRGVLVWVVIAALLAAWELAAYVQHPRADHPTLSSLADQMLDGRPARTLAFLVWLAVGADLARR